MSQISSFGNMCKTSEGKSLVSCKNSFLTKSANNVGSPSPIDNNNNNMETSSIIRRIVDKSKEGGQAVSLLNKKYLLYEQTANSSTINSKNATACVVKTYQRCIKVETKEAFSCKVRTTQFT